MSNLKTELSILIVYTERRLERAKTVADRELRSAYNEITEAQECLSRDDFNRPRLSGRYVEDAAKAFAELSAIQELLNGMYSVRDTKDDVSDEDVVAVFDEDGNVISDEDVV